MIWVLIIGMHVGPMGNGNSNAITNVPGFKSRETCEEALNKIKNLMSGTVKEIRAMCLEVK